MQERKLQDSENELEMRAKNLKARSVQLVSQVSRPWCAAELSEPVLLLCLLLLGDCRGAQPGLLLPSKSRVELLS